MQRDAFFDVPQLASMAATPKFFFRDAHELLSSDGDALSDIGSPSSVTTSPWLLDDEDDELLDTLLLPAELNEDVLRRILVFCQASTLREVKAVDRRTHRIVAELLRDPRRFPRLLFSSLANGGAARRAAHRELPARWGKAIIGATSAAAVVSLRASTDVTTGAGAVRLRLTARPTADVGLERTCFSRSSAATGWVTCLVDRWVSREVFTCTMHIEQLGGEACIGVVGRNFADPSGCSPLRSRHAVMIEGRSGKVYVKGRATGLALPDAPTLPWSAEIAKRADGRCAAGWQQLAAGDQHDAEGDARAHPHTRRRARGKCRGRRPPCGCRRRRLSGPQC